jgi:hypothetical protein
VKCVKRNKEVSLVLCLLHRRFSIKVLRRSHTIRGLVIPAQHIFRDGVVPLVFKNDVQSMDNPRDVTQNCQTDIDEQVSTTSSLQKDTERREENGQDNFADITRFSRISDL